MTMARKSGFMKWIDRQVNVDADLKRKVRDYLRKMTIEQKNTSLLTERRVARTRPSG